MRFLSIIQEAIAEAGTTIAGNGSVPIGTLTITRDVLKRYLLAKGWAEDVTSGAARAKTSNYLNALAGKSLIGLAAEHVWLP
jgi:hypothetical protein